jgi:hypothetical protein
VILLSTTKSQLQLVTAGSAVQNISVSVSWVDANNTTINPTGENPPNGVIISPGIYVIVPSPGPTDSPAPTTQRNIKNVAIANNDPTNAVVITVQIFDGTSISVIEPTFNLKPSYAFMYEDGRGWYLKYLGADVIVAITVPWFP